MTKKYFNIIIPDDPLELLKKIGTNIYSLLENGSENYILGYCYNKSSIIKLKNIDDYEILNNLQSYTFGYIPYDQKNIFLPNAASSNKSSHNFENPHFFLADGVIIVKNKTALFFGTKNEHSQILRKIKSITRTQSNNKNSLSKITLNHNTPKRKYIQNVIRIKEHIQNGDIYEMNYCVNFDSKSVSIDAFDTYKKLKAKTKAPFSAKVSINEAIVLSASPERFLNRSNNKLISQPIKGTIRRGKNRAEDIKLSNKLVNDQKERSENIMIVDLVRNDMSKIANKSSVEVKELCNLYTFKTVHQLISTIQCQINKNIKIATIFKSLYPMGSMTGAPKIRATDIIEKFENFKREIYSGSIGFIAPNQSFDFNVVIRSIIYSKKKKTLSISVGSAITIKSSPEQEYNECLLKLAAIVSVL